MTARRPMPAPPPGADGAASPPGVRPFVGGELPVRLRAWDGSRGRSGRRAAWCPRSATRSGA